MKLFEISTPNAHGIIFILCLPFEKNKQTNKHNLQRKTTNKHKKLFEISTPNAHGIIFILCLPLGEKMQSSKEKQHISIKKWNFLKSVPQMLMASFYIVSTFGGKKHNLQRQNNK